MVSHNPSFPFPIPSPSLPTSHFTFFPHKLDTSPRKLDTLPNKLNTFPHKRDTLPHILDTLLRKLDILPPPPVPWGGGNRELIYPFI